MKKGINRREIDIIINEKQNQGYTKQEIFNELQDNYFDKKTLAIIIANTVSIQRKKRYNVLNATFIVLFFIASMFKIFSILLLFEKISMILVVSVISLSINFWFIYQIFKCRPFVYSFLGLLIFVQIFRFTLQAEYISIWNGFEIGFYAIVGILSFIVKSKLFPNYLLFRPEHDKNGNVAFD
ncbi:MAG: hypothetical protein K9I34_06390 [Bacteroidales bacterium]|nr:hypothetical protein [Bacteroidales bacterium]